MFTHYKDMIDDTKCRNWGGLGDYGSPKVISSVIIRYRVYNFLFDFNRNYASHNSFRFRHIPSYSSKMPSLTYHTCVWSPSRAWSRSSFAVIFSVRKLESLGYRVALFSWSYV